MEYKNYFKPTKLVRLTQIENIFKTKNHLYAKVEGSNPSGSIKDRAVFQMLLGYQEKGILKEDSLIVEATSGNTGIALAYFSSIFKYHVIIVMPESMSQQRRDMITKLGGELCLVKGGMKECEIKANDIIKENKGAFIFGQFENKDNAKAHYLHTGPEIANQIDKVDYFFAGIGTGGTITGAGKYLKEKFNCKVIGVEPLESPLLTAGHAGSHLIQGIGANFIPNVLDQKILDDVTTVKGSKAIEMAKLIRDVENIDCGISSGAALQAAIEYTSHHEISGQNIVVIFPDKGDRYTW